MASPIGRRGFSDENGSWNTARRSPCSARRSRGAGTSDVATFEEDLTARHRLQAEDRAADRRLARPGLADEAQRLAAGDRERHVVDGVDGRLLPVADDEVAHLEQRRRRRHRVLGGRTAQSLIVSSSDRDGLPPLFLATAHLVTAHAAHAALALDRGRRAGWWSGTRRGRTGSARRSGIRSSTIRAAAPGRGSRRACVVPSKSRIACGSAASSAIVYGCSGRMSTSRTVPVSTICPAYITETSSQRSATTPRSCVTRMIDIPRSATSPRSSARISAWIVTSSAVVGSSATSRRGEPARASAIATRCAMPPEI